MVVDRAGRGTFLLKAPNETLDLNGIDIGQRREATLVDDLLCAAGQPWDTLPERESSKLVITMVRNEAEFHAAAMDVFSNSVNADDVVLNGTIYTAGTLKLSPIKATGPHTANNITYYTVVYTFKANRKGWKDKRYDVGYDELVDVAGQGVEVKQLKRVNPSTCSRRWPRTPTTPV